MANMPHENFCTKFQGGGGEGEWKWADPFAKFLKELATKHEANIKLC